MSEEHIPIDVHYGKLEEWLEDRKSVIGKKHPKEVAETLKLAPQIVQSVRYEIPSLRKDVARERAAGLEGAVKLAESRRTLSTLLAKRAGLVARLGLVPMSTTQQQNPVAAQQSPSTASSPAAGVVFTVASAEGGEEEMVMVKVPQRLVDSYCGTTTEAQQQEQLPLTNHPSPSSPSTTTTPAVQTMRNVSVKLVEVEALCEDHGKIDAKIERRAQEMVSEVATRVKESCKGRVQRLLDTLDDIVAKTSGEEEDGSAGGGGGGVSVVEDKKPSSMFLWIRDWLTRGVEEEETATATRAAEEAVEEQEGDAPVEINWNDDDFLGDAGTTNTTTHASVDVGGSSTGLLGGAGEVGAPAGAITIQWGDDFDDDVTAATSVAQQPEAEADQFHAETLPPTMTRIRLSKADHRAALCDELRALQSYYVELLVGVPELPSSTTTVDPKVEEKAAGSIDNAARVSVSDCTSFLADPPSILSSLLETTSNSLLAVKVVILAFLHEILETLEDPLLVEILRVQNSAVAREKYVAELDRCGYQIGNTQLKMEQYRQMVRSQEEEVSGGGGGDPQEQHRQSTTLAPQAALSAEIASMKNNQRRCEEVLSRVYAPRTVRLVGDINTV